MDEKERGQAGRGRGEVKWLGREGMRRGVEMERSREGENRYSGLRREYMKRREEGKGGEGNTRREEVIEVAYI